MRDVLSRKRSRPCRSTSRVSAAAPVRTPTTVALMSPATIFGTRELAIAKRKMSSTSLPPAYSLTPGKIVPSVVEPVRLDRRVTHELVRDVHRHHHGDVLWVGARAVGHVVEHDVAG